MKFSLKKKHVLTHPRKVSIDSPDKLCLLAALHIPAAVASPDQARHLPALEFHIRQ